MKNVPTLLAKIVLIQPGLTKAASATDAAIQNKIYESGMTTLIISNREIKHMEIVKSHEELGLLIKGASKTFKNEAKEKKVGFRTMLFGTLGATLLGNLLVGKRVIRIDDE